MSAHPIRCGECGARRATYASFLHGDGAATRRGDERVGAIWGRPVVFRCREHAPVVRSMSLGYFHRGAEGLVEEDAS
jgi:hypothetical protein